MAEIEMLASPAEMRPRQDVAGLETWS